MTSKKTTQPLRVAIIGAGHRSVNYASYALSHPERMRVTALAEPDPVRRKMLGDLHNLPEDKRFKSYTDIAARPELADAVINGTMDRMHYPSGMALLNAGFDMLLEKPIAQTARELLDLVETAERLNRTVMVGHVLRYAPFYQTAKRLIEEGRIGKVLGLHAEENVSYHHMAVGYVRGKWNREAEETPILLAKSCHDLDILAWLMSVKPVRVASFGSRMFFREEQAPAGATARCLPDCPHRDTCIYSASINYLRSNEWDTYVWHDLEHLGTLSLEQKRAHLEKDSPFGRCVWHCDNDQLDQQRMLVEFDNGSTATFEMNTGVFRSTRELHIFGSEGELDGDFTNGLITIRNANLDTVSFREETIDVNLVGGEVSGHGGGDSRLMEDFVRACLHEEGTPPHTLIRNSVNGHMIGYAALVAQREKRTVELTELGML